MQSWSRMDFWHWKDHLSRYHTKRRYAASGISELLSAGYGLVSGPVHHSVIHNFDWTHPVQQYETAERNQLPKLLTEAVRLVEKESQSAGAN